MTPWKSARDMTLFELALAIIYAEFNKPKQKKARRERGK